VNEAAKVELCVRFRNESEFRTQLETAEGDGRLTYTRWMLWKSPVATSGAVSTSVAITDPSDTPHEPRRSTPDAGKEASQPVVMFDPVRHQ
jgi:hypothetical protein